VDEHDSHKSKKPKKRKQQNGAGSVVEVLSNDSMLELIVDLCEFLRESLSMYMQHVYASHIVRGLLQVLSARPIDDVILHSRRLQQQCHGHLQTGFWPTAN